MKRGTGTREPRTVKLHTPKSPEVGQPSPVDIVMTSGTLVLPVEGTFALPSKNMSSQKWGEGTGECYRYQTFGLYYFIQAKTTGS